MADRSGKVITERTTRVKVAAALQHLQQLEEGTGSREGPAGETATPGGRSFKRLPSPDDSNQLVESLVDVHSDFG